MSEAPQPLRRNRDFVLLQTGQLLSTAGSQATALAYPLLVLAISHSPAQAGLVAFVELTPVALFGLLAGVAADRWNRKRIMIAADSVRAVTLGVVGAVLLAGRIHVWEILVACFVEGTGTAFFSTAQTGALRAVVPTVQLPAAAGAQEARRAIVRVGGQPLGGALYGIGWSVPFVADAISYAFSTASILAMRTPFQQARAPRTTKVSEEIREGFGFLWSIPFLRTTAFLYGLGNFLMPGVLLALVVVGRRQGLSSGEIGGLMAIFGAGTLVGSLASPLVRRLLRPRAILLMELWTWLSGWAFVAHPSVYVLTAAVIPFALAAPNTDSVVLGYGVALTPERLVGRVESVRRTISLLIAPLGPLVAGLLLENVSARATIAVFAVIGLCLALWGTLSPSIRHAPTPADLLARDPS